MNTFSRLFLFALLSGVPAVVACTGLVDAVPPQSQDDAGSPPDGATPIPPTTAVAPTATPVPPTTPVAPTPPVAPTANPEPVDAGPAPLDTSLPVPSFDAGPGSCGAGSVVGVDAIDQAFGGGWRGPGAPQQVCTQADVDALKELFKSASSVKFADVKTALGATCSACAFRPASGPTWGPFVESSGGGTHTNYASCYALASNVTCGRDLANYDLCLTTTCDDAACGTSQEKQACAKSASTNQCKPFFDALKQSCGAKLDTVDARCSNIFQVIGATCGGGLDAGGP